MRSSFTARSVNSPSNAISELIACGPHTRCILYILSQSSVFCRRIASSFGIPASMRQVRARGVLIHSAACLKHVSPRAAARKTSCSTANSKHHANADRYAPRLLWHASMSPSLQVAVRYTCSTDASMIKFWAVVLNSFMELTLPFSFCVAFSTGSALATCIILVGIFPPMRQLQRMASSQIPFSSVIAEQV